jgi:Ca2+-binding RTX toxin-like protein
LDGNTQDDTIYGGDGNDTIFDGINQDVLYGGSGFDTFIFRDMTIRDSKGISYYDSEESSLSRPDYIMGFANPGDLYGDRIDLSKVDAWPDGDRDPLSFGGYVGFTGVNAGPGTIVLGQEVTNTVVYGNVGFNFGDSNRDFKIVIVDDGISYTQYNANDFLV